MFNKNEFAIALKTINELYENQTYFAQASGVNRTYLSQYMNLKLDSPPSPKVLIGIADASRGTYSYMNLMKICGYINYNENDIKEELEEKLKYYNLTEQEYNDAINCFMHDSQNIQSLAFVLKYSPNPTNRETEREKQILLTILNYVFAFIPNDLDLSNNEEKFYNEFNKALVPAKKMLLSLDKNKIINNSSILLFIAKDQSMSPLLDIGDVAKVNKKQTFNNGETILFLLEKQEYIRKVEKYIDHIEFHAMNPYYPVMRLTNKELEEKEFKCIGKVISVENTSAFK